MAYPRAPRCPTEVSTADRPAVAPLPALGFRGVPPRARRDQHAADSPDPRNHQSSELCVGISLFLPPAVSPASAFMLAPPPGRAVASVVGLRVDLRVASSDRQMTAPPLHAAHAATLPLPTLLVLLLLLRMLLKPALALLLPLHAAASPSSHR